MAAPVPGQHRRSDGRTVLAVLTHDPKFDVPLLEVSAAAAASPTSGRWAPVARTRTGWTSCGSEGSLQPSWPGCAPRSGLDLGARARPKETAVSIAAELIGQRWGGSGRALRNCRGPDPP